MSIRVCRTLTASIISKNRGRDFRLDSVASLDELRVPPGNQLEALAGDRAGQFSIRINRQYRVCFVWTNQGPDMVEIVDYHR